MATNFPGSLDAFTNPTSGDTLDNPPHDQQHADVNDAVEALQAKVGVDGSAVTSSLDYQLANFTNKLGSGAAVEVPGTFAGGDTLQAAEMNALPGGIVTATAGGTSGAGYYLLTSDFYTIAETDVTGMTVTFDGVAGRLYRASFDGTLNEQINIYINVGGTNIQRIVNHDASAFLHIAGSIIFTATGSTVAKIRMSSNDGTSNRIEADTDRPAVFVVEDIGPS